VRKRAINIFNFVHLALKLLILYLHYLVKFRSLFQQFTTIGCCQKCHKHLQRFPKHEVGFIFCTGGKKFTVAPHEHVSDQVYASVTVLRHDISMS